MTTPIIIRLGATTELGLIVANTSGWFPNALPLTGSAAAEAIVVMAGAIVLNEAVGLAREIIRTLRR